jgi:hypothetical protein
MQITAQRWERLLFATGGALNLNKCFWYGVEWTFTSTGAPQMISSTTDGPQISLSSGSSLDNPETIQRISTSTGQCTLGIHLAPNGNDNDKYSYGTQQANKMTQRSRRHHSAENILESDFVPSGA